MSNIDSVAGYSNSYPFLQEFQYNIKNSIMKPYTKFLNTLSEKIVADDENSNKRYLVFVVSICLGYLVSFIIVFATSTLTENAILWYANLMLSISPKKYDKLKERTTEFLDSYSINSEAQADAEIPVDPNAKGTEIGNKTENADGKGESHRYISSARDFVRNSICTNHFVIIVKVLITMLIIGGFIVSMAVFANNSYKNLEKIRDGVNNSARIDQIILFLDSATM